MDGSYPPKDKHDILDAINQSINQLIDRSINQFVGINLWYIVGVYNYQDHRTTSWLWFLTQNIQIRFSQVQVRTSNENDTYNHILDEDTLKKFLLV